MAAMMMAVDPVCAKCGRLNKSGFSCCAPGGSWFKKCGVVGTKFHHTWKEGMRACKKWSEPKTVISQQLHAVQMLNLSNNAMIANTKAVAMATQTVAFTPTNKSTAMSNNAGIIGAAITSTTATTTPIRGAKIDVSTNMLMTAESHPRVAFTTSTITSTTPTVTTITDSHDANKAKIPNDCISKGIYIVCTICVSVCIRLISVYLLNPY